ncbi:allophanate hydrolase subunit 1 [bacterium]|nr:allophanate hydrolase subunit 1 [bacterium]
MLSKRYFIGDSCICWSFGDEISAGLSSRIISLYRQLKAEPFMQKLGALDLVPSYTELAIYFNPLECSVETITQAVEELVAERFQSIDPMTFTLESPGSTHIIPVIYNGADLQRVADFHNLTINEVIDRHVNGKYVVAMIGFLPHFPYLIGLDKSLETPRLDTPRKIVPAGAVAIGGGQTGIYPQQSPGGWNILGITHPDNLFSIEPGDSVIFKKVDTL